jgi:hypothetical protein
MPASEIDITAVSISISSAEYFVPRGNIKLPNKQPIVIPAKRKGEANASGILAVSRESRSRTQRQD